jgi:glycosyltransferase involved in cell wall biosynthesis
MKIALIADAFPPLRTSGAVQIRDLALELVRQGHSPTVILPAPQEPQPWRIDDVEGVRVVRLRAPRTKDIGYVARTLGEVLMPFLMRRHFRRSPIADNVWDGVLWYSPSIFHGPFVNALIESSGCRGYLIVRDIFPEWAVDMGLMGRGLPYLFFQAFARYQYSVANVIGVQSFGNLRYFSKWAQQPGRRLDVLQNWLAPPNKVRCGVRIDQTQLAGRKILVYAGNMGVAQGMGILIDLAAALHHRRDIGFLFVGRGSDVPRLRAMVDAQGLGNVLFFDEIDPDEIPDLYAQCSAGILALDSRHKSHNIPGKFLTYIRSGLPVLAILNAGNDLASIISNERVGQACESRHLDELVSRAEILLTQLQFDVELGERCKKLFERDFSVGKAAHQIVAALTA